MVEAARKISIDGEGSEDEPTAREAAWTRPDATPDGDVVGVAAGTGIGPQGEGAGDGGAQAGSYERLMRMFGPPTMPSPDNVNTG
jgi:hypothetical protein